MFEGFGKAAVCRWVKYHLPWWIVAFVAGALVAVVGVVI